MMLERVFTPELLDIINKQLDELRDAEDALVRAESAGLSLPQQREALNEVTDGLRRIKTAFYPND